MFDPTSESGPADSGATSKVYLSSATSRQSTPSPRQQTTAERLAAVDDILESAWAGLASGTLELHRLRATSEHLFSIYMLGFDAGIAAQDARVRQAEHDSDRYYLRAMNGPERAAEIQHRLDRAIAACPPNIDPHSPDYFRLALAGSIGGAA